MSKAYMTAPFRQFGAAGVISASTTSARAALARAKDQVVVVSNPIDGSVCFVNFGTSTNTATNADAAVLSGQSRIFSVPADATHIAVLLDTGTGTIYASCGDGI